MFARFVSALASPGVTVSPREYRRAASSRIGSASAYDPRSYITCPSEFVAFAMTGSVGGSLRFAIARPARMNFSALSYSAWALRSSPNASMLDAIAG